MRKIISIFLIGLVAAVLAFAGALRFYGVSPHHGPPDQAFPELDWLKQEFKLSDAEFTRIQSLHDDYMPRCESMCKLIDQKSAEIEQLLARTNSLTPEVEQKLRESADLRLECEETMLRHFVAVANSMPPDQGKRYLQWTAENTVLAHSKHRHPASNQEGR